MIADKTKALIALSIAISKPICSQMFWHVHYARQLGMTREDLSEIIELSTQLVGATAVTGGAAAYAVFDELNSAGAWFNPSFPLGGV